MNMPILNPQSNALAVQTVEGEARIRDLDLAERLGFAEPRMIRNLIKRHADSLDKLGVRATVKQTPENNGLGGAPSIVYFLNRKQAIFITAKSETVNATDITIEIIEKFDAYERGNHQAQIDFSNPDHLLPLLSAYAEDKKRLTAQIEAAAPKVEAFDRISNADGTMNMTEAAKSLGLPPRAFIGWLSGHGWIYRHAGGQWTAYQDKIKAGHLDHKTGTVQRLDGSDKAVWSVRVTAKGLARLAMIVPGAVAA